MCNHEHPTRDYRERSSVAHLSRTSEMLGSPPMLKFKTNGSQTAWAITRRIDAPLLIASLQIFNTENRILRQTQRPRRSGALTFLPNRAKHQAQ